MQVFCAWKEKTCWQVKPTLPIGLGRRVHRLPPNLLPREDSSVQAPVTQGCLALLGWLHAKGLSQFHHGGGGDSDPKWRNKAG